jgi:hypothetical protein
LQTAEAHSPFICFKRMFSKNVLTCGTARQALSPRAAVQLRASA